MGYLLDSTILGLLLADPVGESGLGVLLNLQFWFVTERNKERRLTCKARDRTLFTILRVKERTGPSGSNTTKKKEQTKDES